MSTKEIINLKQGSPLILPNLESLWKKIALRVVNSKDFSHMISGLTELEETVYPNILEMIKDKSEIPVTENNIFLATGLHEVRSFIWHYMGGAPRILVFYGFDNFYNDHIIPLREQFITHKPKIIEEKENHYFYYEPDYQELTREYAIGGIWLTNPHIPSGANLYADNIKIVAEMLLGQKGLFMIESPSLFSLFSVSEERLNFYLYHQTIYLINFEDIGLAGENLALVLGPEQVIQRIKSHCQSLSIFPSHFSSYLLNEAIKSKELYSLAQSALHPTYTYKREMAMNIIKEQINPAIDYRFGKDADGRHLWIWLQDLPTSSVMLENLLIKEGVAITSGYNYFPKPLQSWKHAGECILVNLLLEDEKLQEGIHRLSTVINRIYKHKLI